MWVTSISQLIYSFIAIPEISCTILIIRLEQCPANATNASRISQVVAVFTQIRAQKQEPKPLVVVGSVNADMVLEVDRLPADGETLGAKTLNTFPGGKASRAHLPPSREICRSGCAFDTSPHHSLLNA